MIAFVGEHFHRYGDRVVADPECANYFTNDDGLPVVNADLSYVTTVSPSAVTIGRPTRVRFISDVAGTSSREIRAVAGIVAMSMTRRDVAIVGDMDVCP